jgi:hypothetical protein
VSAVVVVPARCNGPARSGNGGYASGALAEHVPADHVAGAVEVTLRTPPPLDVPLTVETDGDRTLLLRDGTTVAEARRVPADLDAVEEVGADVAAAAMLRYPGLGNHPFPTCFACGPERAEGDGLRIFPGPVGADRGLVASLWVPHAAHAESSDVVDGVQRCGTATTWAALDCVGGWSEDLEGRPCVLGRMAARVDALPVVGEPHVVVGRHLGREGRKSFTASTLYDADGRVVATARHTWIQVDPAAFA